MRPCMHILAMQELTSPCRMHVLFLQSLGGTGR
jgi:hypothetical protein